ncbi:hypothetical protein Tco_0881495 [Tanacetum coccineum]
MSAPKFADSHNMVAFLAKPTESDGFEQILDFLNANPIKRALMVNPTIYTSCIEQFWATAKVKTVNGEVQLQALVDGKKVIITETSVRRDLQLEDAEGIECLPNADIFEQLALMGYEKPSQKLTFYKAFFSPQWKFLIHTILQCLSAKSTAWNEFSSTIASAIICLATNQKFNFSKYIFESMVKNVDSSVKFLMYPRFVQGWKGFSGAVTPLYPTMMVQAQEEMGEGSAMPTDPHYTSIIQPLTSQPHKKQSRRKQRKDTKIPQSSGPTEPIADEAANEENVPTQSNDPPLSRTTKTAQAKENASLKKRVKKLERKRKSKTPGMKRLFKVGRSAQVTSSEDKDVFNGEEVFVAEQKITLAQALAELRSAKPKIVVQEPVQSTTTIAPSTIPKAKSITFRDPTEEEEQARLAREKAEKVKEANISWDNVQAMIEADRKKHFAALRAQEKRNKPSTKVQKKSTMSTYLKHMAGYKQSQLKNKSFAEIQKLFDKAMTRMAQESSLKRAGDKLEQEKEKKQKIDDDQEEVEMKKLIKVVPDEEEIAIHAIPLATKPPSIVDWKIVKEGKISLFQIIRANGSSKRSILLGSTLLVDHALSYALTATTDAPSMSLQQIPVETPEQPFIEPGNLKFIQSFLKIVGYQGLVDKVSAFFTKNLAQP